MPIDIPPADPGAQTYSTVSDQGRIGQIYIRQTAEPTN